MVRFRKVLTLILVVPYGIAILWAYGFFFRGGGWSWIPLYFLSMPWTVAVDSGLPLLADRGLVVPYQVRSTLFALALLGGGLLNSSLVAWLLWPRRRNVVTTFNAEER